MQLFQVFTFNHLIGYISSRAYFYVFSLKNKNKKNVYWYAMEFGSGRTAGQRYLNAKQGV